MSNRRNCESLQMNLLKLDSPEVEIAVLAYAGDQYQRNLPAYIFYDGTMGNNWCKCVSNEKTGIATSFLKHQCPCSSGLFAMCEYRFPRSPSICDVKRDFKDSTGVYQKSICTIYQDMNYDTAVTTCAANGMTILNANSVELENYMVSYSNVQWPYGFFWFLGKNGTVCSTFSKDKKLSYFKTQVTCINSAYFHCEYQVSTPQYKAAEEPDEISYRDCVRVKNIRDAQGNVIKTICPTDRGLNYDTNRRNCESLNMNFLRISTPGEKTALLEFASDQYRVYGAAYVFFNGVLGNGKCNCVSSAPSGKADVFSIYQCDCAAGLFSICEFKYPKVPSICDVTKDLKNSAGVYVKSVCSVYQDMIYDNAASACIANGMTLFDSNTADMDNALLSYSNTQWPLGTFWVLGKSALCSAISDSGQALFTKQSFNCFTSNHFNCEFIATVPNINAPDEPAEEPYKVCTAVKNIRNANGTRIKTLCSVIGLQNYAGAQGFCATNQMTLAISDDTTVQNAIIAYTGSQYDWFNPGIFWVDAAKSIGLCSTLTNVGQANRANYVPSPNEVCSNLHNYYCQYV